LPFLGGNFVTAHERSPKHPDFRIPPEMDAIGFDSISKLPSLVLSPEEIGAIGYSQASGLFDIHYNGDLPFSPF
jgi:hypothetical protein